MIAPSQDLCISSHPQVMIFDVTLPRLETLETCASNDPSGPGKCNDIEADISILSETLEQESSEGQ